MLKAIRTFFEKLEERRNPSIDGMYNTLKESLELYRQACAQAIATERQLEQQAEKNLARAQEWKNKYKEASEEEVRERAFVRMQQYDSAYQELTIQISTQKNATNHLLDRLAPMERPVIATWLLKSFLAVFPEPAKTPPSLSSEFNEIFELIRKLILEQSEKQTPEKDSKPYYIKASDLLERTTKAFVVFATYYRNHADDPESGPFKERAADLWWKVNGMSAKAKDSVATWTERLKNAEKAGHEGVAQKALARTIEQGLFIPQYEKLIETLATSFDQPMQYDPALAPKSEEAERSQSTSPGAQFRSAFRKKKKRRK